MIKICNDILSPILVNIFNNSLRNGIFPTRLKVAKVIPIFKSGDRTLPENYRPVSILCSLSKVFESVMYERLLNHLTVHNIIIPQQFGFRRKLSPQMALVSLIEKLTHSLDMNEYAVGIFLDLSKAFDSMNHQILLRKLEHYGVRGVYLAWFESYLRNRIQCVEVNNCKSNSILINTGVPQGSILGPLLFLLSINDIVHCSRLLAFVLFADDCNAINSNSNLRDLIISTNIELHALGTWFIANKFAVNMKKTHFMLLCGMKVVDIEVELFLYGKVLKQEITTKFLGVFIDKNLNWRVHINHIRTKISKIIGIIYHSRSCLSLNSLKLLYNSLIYPYLQYGILVWGNASNVHLNKLFVTQKRAIRVITNSPFLAHTHNLFKNNKILKIHDIYKLEVTKFVWNQLRYDLPLINFTFVANYHDYNVRNRLDLRPPNARLKVRKMCISYNGCVIWNTVPDRIRDSLNINTLKIHYKRYLIQLY